MFYCTVSKKNYKHIHKIENMHTAKGNKKIKKTCINITLTHSRKGYLEAKF